MEWFLLKYYRVVYESADSFLKKNMQRNRKILPEYLYSGRIFVRFTAEQTVLMI